MPNVRVYFPAGGVTDQSPFIDTPALYTRPESALNVRLRDRAKKAPRGGQREGTRATWNVQTCAGMPIQAMAAVSTASEVSEYQLGDCRQLGGWEPRASGLLQGICWMLGSTPSMFRDFDDTFGDTAAATAAFAACWHPLSTGIRRAAFAVLIRDTGVNGTAITTRVRMVDEVGGLTWATNLEDRQAGEALGGSPRRIVCNHVAIVAPSLGNALVLLSCQADDGAGSIEGYLYVLRGSDGEYLQRYNIDGWASEVQQCAIRPDGAVAVLFVGSGGAGSTTAHAIAAGGAAQHFRSGIALYRPNLSGGAIVAADPLLREAFGPQLDPAHPYYEAAHGYLRFSEHLARRPRGCYPTSIAAAPDNSLLVTFSNAGWGPNPTLTEFHPTGANGRFSTAALIDATGEIRWEADTDSIRRAYTGPWGTYYNDIPGSGDPFDASPPSLFASAVGPDGRCYVAGARNDGTTDPTRGHNVFRLDQRDGFILWRASIGGAAAAFSAGVAQAGIAVDPTDGNVVVAGRRTDTWGNDTQATAAHLWKFSAASGAVLWTFDLYNGDSGDTDAAAARAHAVSIDPRGRILYVTDRLTA